MSDYVSVNRANWDARVPHHVKGYDLDHLRGDPHALSSVVSFDQARLGSLEGLDVVHLQCHIGSDTVSLARLGARSVTGLDFSAPALAAARTLALECGVEIRYVESELYDAVHVLGRECFDLVYTGIGALCWLPDVAGWAQIVAGLLRPGGRLFVREGHPVLWSLDDPREDGLLVIAYPYFETAGVPFVATSTYVAHDEPLSSPATLQFNHGLGEIFGALTHAGLTVTDFVEHDTAPWNPFGASMEEVGDGEYRLREGAERLPLTYTLCARKAFTA